VRYNKARSQYCTWLKWSKARAFRDRGGSVGGKNYAHVFQTWQDADVITLYKQKGDPTDPGNYRGIFLLDVAGKVLTSVIDKRLKVLIEETMRDSQHGLRKSRSTSHLIHIIRRTQEACKEAGVKAYAVAFDSPPPEICLMGMS
jgi:hypothetical protein